jgi:GTPase Era involved in 16S rRNA processing
VGQKLSIVTFKPQTTRHRVVGIASDTDYQMILFDTPGIMREQVRAWSFDGKWGRVNSSLARLGWKL